MMADMDPSVLWELAKSRHSNFLREAAADHLIERSWPRGPGLGDRLTLACADRLIALGLWLKRRYDCQSPPAPLYGRSRP
jgi:hypothetical protein